MSAFRPFIEERFTILEAGAARDRGLFLLKETLYDVHSIIYRRITVVSQ